jgi:hypothetical protein
MQWQIETERNVDCANGSGWYNFMPGGNHPSDSRAVGLGRFDRKLGLGPVGSRIAGRFADTIDDLYLDYPV